MARKKATAPLPDERDRIIDRLKGELYLARYALIELMPDPQRDLLEASHFCRSMADLDAWSRWAIDGLVRLADTRPGPQMGGAVGTVRAKCPLCGRGAQTPYSEGFLVPVGMHRHLDGSHGSRRCSVFGAAFDLAIEHVRRRDKLGSPALTLTRGPPTSPPWATKPEPELVSPSVNVIKLRDTV